MQITETGTIQFELRERVTYERNGQLRSGRVVAVNGRWDPKHRFATSGSYGHCRTHREEDADGYWHATRTVYVVADGDHEESVCDCQLVKPVAVSQTLF